MSVKRNKREKDKHYKCLTSNLTPNNVHDKSQPSVSTLLKEVRELAKRLSSVSV